MSRLPKIHDRLTVRILFAVGESNSLHPRSAATVGAIADRVPTPLLRR
jgi:hypothetical protein